MHGCLLIISHTMRFARNRRFGAVAHACSACAVFYKSSYNRLDSNYNGGILTIDNLLKYDSLRFIIFYSSAAASEFTITACTSDMYSYNTIVASIDQPYIYNSSYNSSSL